MKLKKKHGRYQDYVIKDGRLVGEFEEMYRDHADPWLQSTREAFSTEKAAALNLLQRLRAPGPSRLAVAWAISPNALPRLAARFWDWMCPPQRSRKPGRCMAHKRVNFGRQTFSIRDPIGISDLTW